MLASNSNDFIHQFKSDKLLGAIFAPGYIVTSVLNSFFLPTWPVLVAQLLLIMFQTGLVVVALRATKSLSWGRAMGVIAIFGSILLVLVSLFLSCIALSRF
jgi:hypothetical protein